MTEPINLDTIKEYFGIVDENESIKLGKNINVFSTNVFIPMNGNIDYTSYLYLTGFVKLVETFLSRTSELNTKSSSNWMLFIYFDDMFNQTYIKGSELYTESSINNNNFNKRIKKHHSQFGNQFKQLLDLYQSYIKHIKENPSKYHFIKLYSYNCKHLKDKFKKYLGHPSTFGSVIRFLPLFDKNISRVFCINISHSISPKLSYLINEWIISNKPILTNGYINYPYPHYKTDNFIKLSISKAIKKKSINSPHNILFTPRILAGLLGFYKKDTDTNWYFNLELFYNIIKALIDDANYKNNFEYGIDELILGLIIDRNDVKDYDYKDEHRFDDIYYFNSINDKTPLPYIIKEYDDKIERNVIGNINHYLNTGDRNLKELNSLIPDNKKDIIKIGYKDSTGRFFFDIKIFYKQQSTKEIDENITILESIKEKLFTIMQQNQKNDQLERFYKQIIAELIHFYFNYKGKDWSYFEIDFLDDDDLELQKMIKMIIEQYNMYNLPKRVKDILFFIKEKEAKHRFVGRDLIGYLGFNDYYVKYITKKDDYNFSGLLNSYDELKPLYLYSSDIDNNLAIDNRFFTIIKLDDSSNIQKIIDLLISYYSDDEKVLQEPYQISIRGGFKKKTHKKNTHKKILIKNKKIKKIKKNTKYKII